MKLKIIKRTAYWLRKKKLAKNKLLWPDVANQYPTKSQENEKMRRPRSQDISRSNPILNNEIANGIRTENQEEKARSNIKSIRKCSELAQKKTGSLHKFLKIAFGRAIGGTRERNICNDVWLAR